ncbi:MAG TPA: YihY/virulence factor BrkB family protein [Ktedonobacterales bacterium]
MALSTPQAQPSRPSNWQPRRTSSPSGQAARQPSVPQERKATSPAKHALQALAALWAKIINDWVFNLAAMLAYTLLMSIVPLLAMFLSFFGLFLGELAPRSEQQLIQQIGAAIPSGGQFIEPALHRLAASSGVLALITILLSAWFGSRLFVTIEQCFGIIYRLPPRGLVRQNLIALLMLLLFVVLMPVLLVVSAAPSFLSTTFVGRFLGDSLAARVWLALATGLAGLLIATALFLVIYAVMPNRPLRIRDAWKGALIAGALLEIYVIAFPFYATFLLRPESYGATAGFAMLVLVFFYYFGVILLLGAEINSFWVGQRPTATELSGILYEVQVRKSLAGAAGPTAGQPQEDLQADPTGLHFTMTPAPHRPSAPAEAALWSTQHAEDEG